MTLIACGGKSAPETAATPEADRAWVEGVCGPESYDPTDWPKYRMGDFEISVPKEYRAITSGLPYRMSFRAPRGTLSIDISRSAEYGFDSMNRPRVGQVWCQARYAGFEAEVISWHVGFNYGFAARMKGPWGGQDDRPWLDARVAATRLEDARALRQAVRTIRLVTP